MNSIYFDVCHIAEIDDEEKEQLDHCLDCGCSLTENEMEMNRSFCFSCLRPGGDRIDD